MLYYDAPTQPERKPLREVFPTQNGHRMRPCPRCGNLMARYPDGYRCLNIGAGCTRTVYCA